MEVEVLIMYFYHESGERIHHYIGALAGMSSRKIVDFLQGRNDAKAMWSCRLI
jgi:hypothetical protein